MLAGAAVVFLVFYQLWIRREVTTSFGVAQTGREGSAYVERAESLRRFRILGIFWLQICMATVFFAASGVILALSWKPQSHWRDGIR